MAFRTVINVSSPDDVRTLSVARNSDTGEFRVRICENRPRPRAIPAADYFTDSEQDALFTALHMAGYIVTQAPPVPVNTNPIPLGPETPQKFGYVPGLRAGFLSSCEELAAMDAPNWLPLGSMACGIQAGLRDEPCYVRRAFHARPGAF